MMNQATGTDVKIVPYKGGGIVITDIIAGRIEMMWSVLPVARSFIDNGKLRALAVASPRRATFLPGVPTTAESGWPTLIGAAWNGVVVPAGTPRAIIAKLNGEITRGLSSPEAKERYRQLAMEPFQENTPDEFRAFLKSETAKCGRHLVIKQANVKPE